MRSVAPQILSPPQGRSGPGAPRCRAGPRLQGRWKEGEALAGEGRGPVFFQGQPRPLEGGRGDIEDGDLAVLRRSGWTPGEAPTTGVMA